MKYYKNLSQGQIVDVYLESDKENFVWEGQGVLIERASSWEEPVPFPYKENPVQVNLIKEKWKVLYKNRFGERIVTRWIYKFHSVGDIRILEEDRDFEFIPGFCVDILGNTDECDKLKIQLKEKKDTELTRKFKEYVKNLI